MHNTKTLHEKLFNGQLISAYNWYNNLHGSQGVQHYAINSLFYLRTIKDKYVWMYNKFIKQLHMYAEAVKILAKGYLPKFAFNSTEIERNFRYSKNQIKENESRL